VNKLLFSISADHTARCWVYDVGDCTRIYKGHHHTVSCIQVENGLGKIEMLNCILINHRSVDLVFTGCGDALVRCFDARSGVVKRSLKSHTLAVNCIQVGLPFLRRSMTADDRRALLLIFFQIVKDRLFSGSVDGTVKVWDISDLKGDVTEDMKSADSRLKPTSHDRGSADNRSDVDSGIDERDFRDRRAQNMV
jgi:WD repeat-containing protein 86